MPASIFPRRPDVTGSPRKFLTSYYPRHVAAAGDNGRDALQTVETTFALPAPPMLQRTQPIAGLQTLLILSPSLTPAVAGAFTALRTMATGVRVRLMLSAPPTNRLWTTENLLPNCEAKDILFADPRRSAEGMARHNFGPQWMASSTALHYIQKHRMAGVIVCGTDYLSHFRAVRYCKAHGVPCVLSTEESVTGERPSALLGMLRQRILNAAGCVAVHGSLGRAYALRHGVPDARIAIAPLNPDLTDFERRDRAAATATAARFGWTLSRRRLVVCSHLVETKRVDLVIDAMADIDAVRPNWDLVIIGDGPLRQWLKFRVASDLRHRVHFTGFLPDRKTLAAVLSACDVAVVPSDYDPWSAALVEAAAAGLALVASDAAGAASELVASGENGRVFAHRSRTALHDALLEVTEERQLAVRKMATERLYAVWSQSESTVFGLATALRRAGATIDGMVGSKQASTPLAVTPHQPALPEAERPTLAIIGGGLIPYRLHFHRRLCAELTAVRLLTINTLPTWYYPKNAMNLTGLDVIETDLRTKGPSESMGSALQQWQVGGRIVRELRARDTGRHGARGLAAVVCNGYNHIGHVRVMIWCKLSGIPCILNTDSNSHGDRTSGAKRLFKQVALRMMRPFLSAVTVCGRLGIDYFRRYGYNAENVFVSPYEPDYEQIRQLPQATRDAVAVRYELRPGRRRLVFCGRLISAKRPDLALGAFLAIASQRPELDFVIIGDGQLRKQLESMVPPELADRVRFTGFMADPAQIGSVYMLSDVFILPSTYEPWAVVVNEAAAAGCVLVATSVVGAAHELIRDGYNGRLVPAENLPALTAALLDATDPALIDERKAATKVVLAEWRRDFDPVTGLRKALASSGVNV